MEDRETVKTEQIGTRTESTVSNIKNVTEIPCSGAADGDRPRGRDRPWVSEETKLKDHTECREEKM